MYGGSTFTCSACLRSHVILSSALNSRFSMVLLLCVEAAYFVEECVPAVQVCWMFFCIHNPPCAQASPPLPARAARLGGGKAALFQHLLQQGSSGQQPHWWMTSSGYSRYRRMPRQPPARHGVGRLACLGYKGTAHPVHMHNLDNQGSRTLL